VNGRVSGAGGITINGQLTLTNPGNTYSGATTLNGSLSLRGGKASDISGTGQVKGYGLAGAISLSGGFVSFGSLSVFGPSGSGGSLSTGDLSLGSSTGLSLHIDGPAAGVDYSQVHVMGTVNVTGSGLGIVMSPTFVPSINQEFILIDNDGIDAIVGTFNGLPEGATITINGAYQFRVSYHGGDGNDLSLTSTLVPKTWSGAASDKWSDAGNWLGGVPGSGDTLVFPSGAQHLTNVNDLAAGTVFGSITFNGSGYNISGNAIGLSGGFQGSGAVVFGPNVQLVSAQTIGMSSLTMNGDLDLQSYTVTANGSSVSGNTVNGRVSGAGGITINGQLTLTNPGNTYSGATTLNGSLSLRGGKASDISGTGQVKGYGLAGAISLSGGFVSFGSLSVFGPSGSGGSLSTGDLSLGSSTGLSLHIDGPAAGVDYSQVHVMGTVNVTGSGLGIVMSPTFVPSINQEFILIDNDGIDAIVGTFNGLPEGATITINGAYPFRLSYFGGDGNDIVLTSLSGAQPTLTQLSSSLNPSFIGQSVTFTAEVTADGGTPTGNVSFREGPQVLGVAPLLGGTASFTTSALGPGPHAISTLYGGDGTYGASASGAVVQVVNVMASAVVSGGGIVCAGQSATIQAALVGTAPWDLTWSDGVQQTGIGSSPATRSVAPGATTTYTVSAVSDVNGPGTASGSALVTANLLPTAVASGTATINLGQSTPLSGSGGASCSWSPSSGLDDASSCTPIATPTTTTVYTLVVADATGCSSTNNPTVTVTVITLIPTTTALVSSLNPSAFGQVITFAAMVGSASGVPTGAVTFRDGVTVIGEETLDASGQATLATSALRTGSHSITASYSGDASFDRSASPALRETITDANACGAFGAPRSYGTAVLPVSLASGDFNGDNEEDIAVVTFSGNGVSILLGMGDGTFEPPVVYGTEVAPVSVAVGDFDSDGRLDLVVINRDSNSMSILFGRGDGAFQPSINYATGSAPFAVAVLDANGDGVLDVAVANSGSDSVSILLGRGDGTFVHSVDFATGASPDAIAVGDFNNDGNPDLAVAIGGFPGVSILLGNGNGTFRAAVSYGTGAAPYSVAVEDLNGDGRLDLAVANLGASNVSILLGNGDGTFASAVNYGQGTNPFSVVVADVNGDGNPDLAVPNLSASHVSALLGNGDGTFQNPVNYDTGMSPRAIVVADLDWDGRPDVITANSGSNDVSVLLGACPATHLAVAGPLSSSTGSAANVAVTALDVKDHPAPDYTGTVYFLSTDIAAVLPANYTFTPADAGTHTFPVTFNTAGPQRVRVIDMVVASITGSTDIINVLQSHSLTITLAGTSAGTVTSSPAGIDCGATCSASLAGTVMLTPTPGAAAVFGGWSGDCSGGPVTTITMDADKACTATFNTKPDLVENNVGTSSSNVSLGDTVTITDTVKNQSGGPAYPGTSTTKFWLSVDTTLDASDVFLGSRMSVPALGPGATSNGSTDVVIPLSTQAGSYYVVAQADGDNNVPESNEGNNLASTSLTVRAPDLTVSSLVVPTAAGAGQSISVTDTTKNLGGSGTAPASVTSFYLSADSLLDAGDASFGSRPVPSLAVGVSDTATSTLTLPSPLVPGTYFIIAKADGPNAFVESSEANNTASTSILIGPDLTISMVQIIPGSPKTGQMATVKVTTQNAGGETAGASSTKIYLRSPSRPDVLLGARLVPALTPGATDPAQVDVMIPASTPPGPGYMIVAVADDGGAVLEANEANNVGLSGSFKVK
jgi:hypothetical protein